MRIQGGESIQPFGGMRCIVAARQEAKTYHNQVRRMKKIRVYFIIEQEELLAVGNQKSQCGF